MVHIDTLIEAVQRFHRDQVRATKPVWEPDKFNTAMREAQEGFRAFCDKHELPVDFTNYQH